MSTEYDRFTRFHVIDTETVGFKGFEHGGGVCEISIRDICPDTLSTHQEYYSRIHPEGPISAAASGVHGISNKDVEDCPTMMEWLLTDAQDIWASHQEPFSFWAYSAGFDYKFLNRYIDCDVIIVDVLVLARRYIKGVENHKMQTLRYALDLDSIELPNDVTSNIAGGFDAHSASGDTRVLLKLIYWLTKHTGMTVHELMIDAQRFEPIELMTFGKHKGTPVEQLAKNEPDYLHWCLKNVSNMSIDMRKTMEFRLKEQNVEL